MKIVMLGGNTKKEIEKRLQIVAAAGNLSRADGTVTEVFESRNDYEANLKLARAVVGYGHKSISEHDYLVFAIENVTPVVEQTIIEYRLTSFTIKSRRNVDFRTAGFYVPDFKDKDGNVLANNRKLRKEYKDYMQSLFDKYGSLVDEELPIEDCRYVLPYSFYSNIIMGCDANEFLRMTADLLYGKNSNITELHELGLKFEEMIHKYVPYLVRALDGEKEKKYYEDKMSFVDDLMKKADKTSDLDYYETLELGRGELLPNVRMTKYTDNPDWFILCNILMGRYQLSQKDAAEYLHRLSEVEPDIKRKMMQALIHSKNQRELEQVCFSYEIPIELAVLTHITRHRLHSLIVPDFVPMWNLDNYMIPDSIKANHEDEYREIFKNNKLMMEYFKEQGVREEDLVYFYLSGNACNIYTTMNGRMLEWFSRMRTCNKAQWAIKKIADQMVAQAKLVAPLMGEGLGPTCVVEGYCPEGKDSCKARGVVVLKKEKKD